MRIYGLQKLTLLDYPGNTACTIFTSKCNFRCPYCHNAELAWMDPDELMTEGRFLEFLKTRRGLLDGIVISGGEPTLQNDLVPFMVHVRNMGFKVKLDTNGTSPSVLREIFKRGAADYIAMDIKNSISKYDITARPKGINNVTKVIAESINLIMCNGIDYEFRTTVVKEFHELGDFREIDSMIKGASKYFLQPYKTPPNHNPRFTEPDREFLEQIQSSMSVPTYIRGI